MFTSKEIADDFLQFSPPFLHQEDPFYHFLPQQLVMETLDISSAQETMLNESNVHHEAVNDKNAESSKRVYRKNARTPRRRAGKKDRHSKIVTAQGTRDRRLRLSLEIARKFFNLQDMLGFGIASKTVEWLLKQSEAAIDELKQACTIETKTAFFSSNPECGQVSGHKGVKGKDLDGNVSKWIPVNKAPSGRDARDLRVQARARARERTLEKMRMEKPKQPYIQVQPHQLNQFLSSDPFPEVVDKLRGSCSNVRTSKQVLAKYSHPPRHPGPTGDVVSKSFVINTVSKPSIGVSSYSNTILPNYQENWSNEIAKMTSPICYANRMLEVNSMGSIGRPSLV